MGDDVLAPNKRTYEWHEGDRIGLFSILEDYIGCNLPGYFWRGFAGEKWVADVNLHRDDLSLSREITLAENWDELCVRVILFLLFTRSMRKENLCHIPKKVNTIHSRILREFPNII